jgi:hypothetical protein
MPLEDLTALGYNVFRPPDVEGSTPPTGPSVYGYDRSWILQPGQDEAAVVTEATNHKKQYDKLVQGQSYFADAYANWPTMTAAQKDAVMRNSQRALANLIRQALNNLTDEGP